MERALRRISKNDDQERQMIIFKDNGLGRWQCYHAIMSTQYRKHRRGGMEASLQKNEL